MRRRGRRVDYHDDDITDDPEVALGGASRWQEFHALRYRGVSLDTGSWTATFGYTLDGPQESLSFTETVTFPAPARPPEDGTLAVLHRVLQLLALPIGTSYYKLAAPREVALDGVRLVGRALPWAVALFRHGLAEYAYRNDLPHVRDLELTTGGTPPRTGAGDPRARAVAGAPPLVPVGGGKDSLVAVEALRAAGLEPVLFAVNPNEIITGVQDAAGLRRLAARRTLDPQLFDLNRAGAHNGHVPVTAINSLVAVATAVLHGLGPVVMSNESSASAPNLDWHGPVNHQWSKGVEAERLLREAIAAHAGVPDAYFSLLRPLSELRIAQLFAAYTRYDAVVTSCNAAFRLADRSARWCGDCPKCRFVFLALAPFLPRHRLVGIVGADLLADEGQLPGFRELVGRAAARPFECVGETGESLAALRLAAEHPEWSHAPVVRRLRSEIPDAVWPSDADVARALGAGAPHHVPSRYRSVLASLTGTEPTGPESTGPESTGAQLAGARDAPG